MRITFTATQQEILLDWARKNARAEMKADCEPSGYRLEIEVSAYSITAEAVFGAKRIRLGEAHLELSPPDPAASNDRLI